MTSPYLTVEEVAEFARCSAVTVRRAVKSGDLVAFRPGGNRLVFLEDDVRAWVEGQPAVEHTTPSRQGQRARRRRDAGDPAPRPGTVADLREIERKAAAG